MIHGAARSRGVRWARRGALIALVCGWIAAPRAQAVPEPTLKAAFLFNFVKFTEWPADAVPPDAPLTFCVTDAAVAQALEPMVTGRVIGQHPLVVSRVKLSDPLRACAVVYAGGLNAKSAAALLDALKGASVFSVADFDRFTAIGGVAHFFPDGDRIGFAINLKAAERARLRLSSKLLNVAKIVKDGSCP